MKHLTKGIAFIATLAASSVANALYIDAVPNGNSPGDPSEQVVPDDNDYATRDKGIWTADTALYSVGDTVLFGNNLASTTTESFNLTFTYLGAEAGDVNGFYYAGSKMFETTGGGTTPDTSFTVRFNGGLNSLLNFSFINEPGTEVKNDAANGSQVNSNDPKWIDPDTGLNKTSTNFNLFEVSEDYFLISFDDGWRGDDNHDDMVIAVRATEVPEPGTLALLGLGLAGLALRFKAKK